MDAERYKLNLLTFGLFPGFLCLPRKDMSVFAFVSNSEIYLRCTWNRKQEHSHEKEKCWALYFTKRPSSARVPGYMRCGLRHRSQKYTRFITKKSGDVFGNVHVCVVSLQGGGQRTAHAASSGKFGQKANQGDLKFNWRLANVKTGSCLH